MYVITIYKKYDTVYDMCVTLFTNHPQHFMAITKKSKKLMWFSGIVTIKHNDINYIHTLNKV